MPLKVLDPNTVLDQDQTNPQAPPAAATVSLDASPAPNVPSAKPVILPSTTKLDEEATQVAPAEDDNAGAETPSIQGQIGQPIYVTGHLPKGVIRQGDRGHEYAPTTTGYAFGDEADPSKMYSAMTDAQKADYAKFFADRKNPPTAQDLDNWYQTNLGRPMGNADEIVKHFTKYGTYSSKEDINPITVNQGATQSWLSHAANAVPFDFGDKVEAAADIFANDQGHPNIWNSNATLGQLFRQNADIERAQLERDSAEHPWASMGGELTGAAINSLLTGAAGEAAGMGNFAEHYGEFNRQLLEQAGQGALYGAGNAGPGNRLKGAALGAAVTPAIAGASALPYTVVKNVAGLGRSAQSVADEAVANVLPEDWEKQVSEAQAAGVPMWPADTNEQARGLFAATVRQPGENRDIAVNALRNRQSGLQQRISDLIEQHLGPVVDTNQLGENMMETARQNAAPLYQQFHGQRPMGSDAIDNLMTRPSMKQALDRAFGIAAEEGENPRALGMQLDENGHVILQPTSMVRGLDKDGNIIWKPADQISQDEAAAVSPNRFVNVDWTDPNSELEPRRVTLTGKNMNGKQRSAPGEKPSQVTVNGPLDLTQFIRSLGGVRDAPPADAATKTWLGGDLKSAGITNKPRDIAFGANSDKFLGPIINNNHGMGMDEATRAAWEAGYFPEYADRPEPNDLIDRLTEEYNGRARYFTPDALDEVSRFEGRQADKNWIEDLQQEGKPLAEDTAQPATEADVAKAAAEAPTDQGRAPDMRMTYTPKTLDYVKRGLDDYLNTWRDKTTQRLRLDEAGTAVDRTRRAFLDTVDPLFPQWKPARDIWSGTKAGMNALEMGKDSLNLNVRDLNAEIKNLSPYERDLYALGNRRAMVDKVENMGDNADFVGGIAGREQKRQSLALLHGTDPEAYGKFTDALAQEQKGWQTYSQGLLGSKTALNLANDNNLQALTNAAHFFTGGAPLKTAVKLGLSAAFKGLQTQKAQQATTLITQALSAKTPEEVAALSQRLEAEAAKRGIETAVSRRVRSAIGQSGLAGGAAFGNMINHPPAQQQQPAPPLQIPQ
jgi:hypothetical protein